jgi:hypothetical protein
MTGADTSSQQEQDMKVYVVCPLMDIGFTPPSALIVYKTRAQAHRGILSLNETAQQNQTDTHHDLWTAANGDQWRVVAETVYDTGDE